MSIKKQFTCSFCSRRKEEVEKLIVGKENNKMSFICNYCIEICSNALKDLNNKNKVKLKSITPKKIYEQLSEVIEGQEDAKKTLSVVAYNHYKRINYHDNTINLDKSNVLLIAKYGNRLNIDW